MPWRKWPRRWPSKSKNFETSSVTTRASWIFGDPIIFICILYVYMVLKNFNGSSVIHFFYRDMIVIRVWHQSALRLETRLTRLTRLTRWKRKHWDCRNWGNLFGCFGNNQNEWSYDRSSGSFQSHFSPTKPLGWVIGLRWICQGAILAIPPMFPAQPQNPCTFTLW